MALHYSSSDSITGLLLMNFVRILQLCSSIPTPEELGYPADRECPVYVGGEKPALEHLEHRLRVEEDAFRQVDHWVLTLYC